jgi:hypothetical protein
VRRLFEGYFRYGNLFISFPYASIQMNGRLKRIEMQKTKHFFLSSQLGRTYSVGVYQMFAISLILILLLCPVFHSVFGSLYCCPFRLRERGEIEIINGVEGRCD